MPKLKLIIAYLGTNYSGWQMQKNKNNPNIITIQGLIEKQLSRICDCPITMMGSGRTDAGVHANCQVAHCRIPEHKAHINWQLALNTSLPPDIRIKKYAYVDDDFHALFDVQKKAYIYRLWLDRKFFPPHLYPVVWDCGELNLEMVDKAIPYLIGEHDFASFQNSGGSIKSSIRTIYNIVRSPRKDDLDDHEIQIYFEANGFLKQMVRNLTGLLVACGRNRFNPEDIPKIIHAKNRAIAPTSAPAKGLCMYKVWYSDDIIV